ncbi:MAG: M48 family metallopeptidase [Chloroflexota bacterium]|nr:M48 family metallopeptidase [Dehalococcoidia bacterium]MDW8254287.1 M48 family metallopeptidase [Chloroflexota bacterium]
MAAKRETVVEIDGATVIKSRARRRTFAWRWVDGTLVLRVPARASRAEIERVIALARERAERPSRHAADDATLRQEAEALNERYFGGALRIAAIRYATMTTRRGSCTPAAGEIRISRRLAHVPSWVRQAVIHHELCHLLEPGHGPAFRALEARYPLRAEAEDYLALLERGARGATPLLLSEEERAVLLALLSRTGALPSLRERLAAEE